MTARVHVLAPGTVRDMHGREVAITDALLRELADSYDPALYQAPVVVGHPQHNSPAFGLVAKPQLADDGLEVALTDLDPAFVAAHRAKRYPSRSLSFWPAGHPDNPLPDKGRAYIRHLGFLGGVPPAVKGLRGADLAEPDTDVITLELQEPSMPEQPAANTAPTEQPSAGQPAPTNTAPADLAEREAALAARAAEIDAREQAIAAREQAAREQAAAIHRAEVVAFCESLAEQARLRPADVPRVVEVLLALDEARPDAALDFAEPPADGAAPQAQTPAQWLRQRLSEREPLVELGEVASKARVTVAAGRGKSDEQIARAARAKVAEAKARGEVLSFAAAVALAEAED